jgi:hypothetical protein
MYNHETIYITPAAVTREKSAGKTEAIMLTINAINITPVALSKFLMPISEDE